MSDARRLTYVWAALSAVTVVTWWLGHFQAGRGGDVTVVVAVAVLALAPLARYVPKPALAALLLLTAARLIDPPRLAYSVRASWVA